MARGVKRVKSLKEGEECVKSLTCVCEFSVCSVHTVYN